MSQYIDSLHSSPIGPNSSSSLWISSRVKIVWRSSVAWRISAYRWHWSWWRYNKMFHLWWCPWCLWVSADLFTFVTSWLNSVMQAVYVNHFFSLSISNLNGYWTFHSTDFPISLPPRI